MKRRLKRSKETYYFPFVVHFWSMTQRLKPLLYGAHTELKKKLPTKGKKYSWKCQTFPSITVSAFIPFVLRHIIHGERSLTYDSWSTVEVWDECGVSKWNRRESLRGSVNSAWWMSSKSFVLHLGSRLLPTRGPILNTYWVLMEHTAIIHHRTKDVVLELGCVKD